MHLEHLGHLGDLGQRLTPPPATESAGAPWFRSHPAWVLAVAGILSATVLALRLTTGTAEDAVNLLYTLPVALIALAFGRRAGLLAGAAAVALVALWAAVESVELSAIGWASRAVPLLLLGGLLGDASDRLVATEERRRSLEAAAQRQRDASEVNDTLVQGMAAAKWSLEAGRHEAGLRTLEETLDLGHRLVSKLLRESGMGPGEHHAGNGTDPSSPLR